MPPIHVGTLVYDYQPTDVFGPFDLLMNCSKLFFSLSQEQPVDQATIDRAPDFVFHHIGDSPDPLQLMCGGLRIQRTVSVEEAPKLDILLLGGPDPSRFKFSEKYVEFIKKHVDSGKLLWTTCTGAIAFASTGFLDGKTATVNNSAFQYAIREYPKVNWTREKKWVVDGNIWTGGGAIAGMDMVAHWLGQNFGLEVLKAGALTLDYEPRDVDGQYNVFPQRYDESGKRLPTHVWR